MVTHHKKVATPEDPSTARFGESLYEFYKRTIPQGFVEVWEIEKKRLGRQGVSVFNPFRNRLIIYNLMHVLYLGLIYKIFGAYTVAFHLLYSLVIVLMLEAVNYLEHYGLERKKEPSGKYE